MMTRHTVRPTPPFSFKQSLEFLKCSKVIALENEVADEAFTKAIRVKGKTIVFCLKSMGSVEAPELTCTLYILSPQLQDAALKQIRFFLSLDDDLRPFYALAELDDAFTPIIKKLYGYHQVKFLTPFDAACWAIVTQRTPNSYAYKSWERLIERLGSSLMIKGKQYGAFPDPAQLFHADPKAILEATNNLRKTGRLIEVAKAFLTADEDFLRYGPYDEVLKWLKTIPGIGTWSAEFIMLRGLGRMERTPWSDMGLIEAASEVYARGLTLNRRHVKQIADLYGTYQGYWVHYLKVAR